MIGFRRRRESAASDTSGWEGATENRAKCPPFLFLSLMDTCYLIEISGCPRILVLPEMPLEAQVHKTDLNSALTLVQRCDGKKLPGLGMLHFLCKKLPASFSCLHRNVVALTSVFKLGRNATSAISRLLACLHSPAPSCIQAWGERRGGAMRAEDKQTHYICCPAPWSENDLPIVPNKDEIYI